MSWNPGRYATGEAGKRAKNLKVSFTLSGFIIGAIMTYTGYPLIHRMLNLVKTDKTQTDPAFYQQHKYVRIEIVKGVNGIQPYVVDAENKDIRMGIGHDMHEQSPGGLIEGLDNRIKDGYLGEYLAKNLDKIKGFMDLQARLQEFGFQTQLKGYSLESGYANPALVKLDIVKTPDGKMESVIEYGGKRGPLLEDRLSSMVSKNYNPDQPKRKKFLGIF